MVKLTRGERFKDARIVHNQYKKQTMDEVSAATGVSKSLIQSLEDDSVKRSVGYDKVAKLAAHYHVTTDYLLGLSDDPAINKSAVDELGLSPESIKWIKYLKEKTNSKEYYAVNLLFESPEFQMMFSNLLNYVYSLNVEMLTSCIFDDCMERNDDSEAAISQYMQCINELAEEEHTNSRDKTFLKAEYERIALSATNGLWNVLADEQIGFTLSSMFSYRATKHITNLMENIRNGAVAVREEFIEEAKP